jgi:hypothetical protein
MNQGNPGNKLAAAVIVLVWIGVLVALGVLVYRLIKR